MPSTSHSIPGLLLTDHRLQVPLDHGKPAGEQITIFGRQVDAVGKAGSDLPWLVFFQGGPGFGAPRPLGSSGWLGRACREFHVLLLDERGTGLSTPVSTRMLQGFSSAQEQADYLSHFRTDSIVRDAEAFRQVLTGGKAWTALGQSYGGFCITRYLSAAPEGLCGAIFTGGLPSLHATAEDVYRSTFPLVEQRNRGYYERYPGDAQVVSRILAALRQQTIKLPAGDVLSPRRFLSLGLPLGFTGGWEQLHYMFESAFCDGPDGQELSYIFLREVENLQSFETNPIYALLHEACYTQGCASNWAAERVRAELPQFASEQGDPPLFTGEMIFPWMFEDMSELRPLRAAAEILAAKTDWPKLYDADVLAQNKVPAVAAVYHGDMYVEREFSLETAAAIKGLRSWVTSEYEHNGLRSSGSRVFEHLLEMLQGKK